jgi:peptidyl-prolyl cis-trans isomerase C
MRTARLLCVALVLVGFTYSAMAQEKAPLPKPTPVAKGAAATVNGQPIPEKALQAALRGVPPDKYAEARADILNHFVDNVLIEQHLLQLRIDVPKPEVDKAFAQIKEQMNKSQNPAQSFEKWLEAMAMTEDEARTHIAADLRWDKYVNQQVTDKVLRDYFDKNMEMFDGTMVRARHILLSPPTSDAQALQKARVELELIRQNIEQEVARGLAKLPATTDTLTREKERTRLSEDAFSKTASAKSACPSKEQGGDLGFFPRAGSMVEPFARAAFGLKPHNMSEIVTTQFGVHLILATERKPGKPTKFEDLKDAVKEVYADRVLREGLLAQLRPKAKVVFNPPAKP